MKHCNRKSNCSCCSYTLAQKKAENQVMKDLEAIHKVAVKVMKDLEERRKESEM